MTISIPWQVAYKLHIKMTVTIFQRKNFRHFAREKTRTDFQGESLLAATRGPRRIRLQGAY
jgi:hypothetical protein